MPRVELQDAFGQCFTIATTSRELLQAWFDEWLPVMYPADADPGLGDPVIRSVYPLDATGTGWDWPGDSRYIGVPFRIPRDPAKALAALDEQRARIEAQTREARYDRDQHRT
jgi:hypothetical protein